MNLISLASFRIRSKACWAAKWSSKVTNSEIIRLRFRTFLEMESLCWRTKESEGRVVKSLRPVKVWGLLASIRTVFVIVLKTVLVSISDRITVLTMVGRMSWLERKKSSYRNSHVVKHPLTILLKVYAVKYLRFDNGRRNHLLSDIISSVSNSVVIGRNLSNILVGSAQIGHWQSFSSGDWRSSNEHNIIDGSRMNLGLGKWKLSSFNWENPYDLKQCRISTHQKSGFDNCSFNEFSKCNWYAVVVHISNSLE